MRKLKANVPPRWTLAFLSVMILGLCVHLFKFTNLLPNKDTLYNFYSDQNVITSGRWLLSLACGISSYYDLPWVNGLMSLVFIGISAALITDIFRMKNPVLIVLSAGLLAAFPGITETFFYEYTADGYMLAMVLGTLAVWLSRIGYGGKGATLAAAGCICCACGIYQSYVCFALVLALCYFILELLEGKLTAKQMKGWIFRQIFLYGAGLAAYYLLWKVLMAASGVVANDYHGIDTLSIRADTLIRGAVQMVKAIAVFFLEWDVLEHGWTLYSVLNVIFLAALAFGLVFAAIRSKLWQRKGSLALVLLCLAAIPVSVCLWSFLSQEVVYRPMMLPGLCVLFLFGGVLYERWLPNLWKDAMALLLAVILFNYGLMANISYYYMNRSYQATFAAASEMAARIHMLDTDADKIAVAGEVSASLVYNDYAREIPLFGQLLETNLLFNEWNLVNFLNETFYCRYEFAPGALETPEVQAALAEMTPWPGSGAIRSVGDTILIKLSE